MLPPGLPGTTGVLAMASPRLRPGRDRDGRRGPAPPCSASPPGRRHPISFWRPTRDGAIAAAVTISLAALYGWLRHFVLAW